jgi:threonine dehydrogenase-like Zn-dependent dehydrogenase
MALRVAGCSVTLVSRQPESDVRASLMAAIGGRYVSVERDSLTQVMRGLERIDVVYEAVGASAPAFEALQALGPNGLFVFTGVPGRREAPDLDSGALMRGLVLGNQVLLGTVNAGRDAFEAAVRDLEQFMQRWPDAVRALITDHVPLEQVPQMMATRGSGIKTVVDLV